MIIGWPPDSWLFDLTAINEINLDKPEIVCPNTFECQNVKNQQHTVDY